MAIHFLFPLCLFWSLGTMFPLSVAAEPTAAISEVMWAGSDRSSADEWIEIVAIGGTVSLDGWQLLGGTDGENILFTFPVGSSVSVGTPILVSNYPADQSRLSVETPYVDSSISLSNSQLFLQLTDANGEVKDSVDDGVGAPFAGNNNPKASMERRDLLASGTDAENWKTAEESKGFDEGEPIFGTPGYIGSVQLPNPNPQSSQSSISSFSSQSSTTSTSSQSSTTSTSSQSSTASQSTSSSSHSSHSSISSHSSSSSPPYVIISEILANPDGSDTREWIEIQNRESIPVSIVGWTLYEQGSSKRFVFPEEEPSLKPKEFRVFDKTVSDIPLPNAGGTVVLSFEGTHIDTLSYPLARTEESYGRLDQSDQRMVFCTPTKHYSNDPMPLDIHIDVQSGEPYGVGKVSLNLQAVSSRSLSGQACQWDYGDGFVSDACNPPSHTFDWPGNYDVVLQVEPTCSVPVTETLRVRIDPIPLAPSTSSSSSAQSVQSLSGGQGEPVHVEGEDEEGEKERGCLVTTQTGIVLSEIYPSPAVGAEEWIELYNTLPLEVSLCGWLVDDIADGGSAPKKLEELHISPYSYAVLSKSDTGLALNNGGDDVRLVSPNGLYASLVTYPSLKTTKSFSYDQYLHEWCTSALVTEGKQNICAEATTQVDIEKKTTTKKVSSQTLGLTVKYQNTIVNEQSSSSSVPANLSILRSQLIGTAYEENTNKKYNRNSSIQWVPLLLGLNAGLIVSSGIGGLLFLRSRVFRGLREKGV